MTARRHFRTTAWIIPALAWLGLIFFSSTSLAAAWSDRAFALVVAALRRWAVPVGPPGNLYFLMEKGFHFTLFLVLSLLLGRAIDGVRHKTGAILLFGLVIGSASEYLQCFFSGRDPALRDVALNVISVVAGLLLASKLWRSGASRAAGSLDDKEDRQLQRIDR